MPAPSLTLPLPLPRRRLLCLAAALPLAGCAGPALPPPWPETAARELGLSVRTLEVQGRRVTLTRRAAAVAAPVVVYVPGLGQGADAGQRWAAAWARAGHAVIGVQPLAADEAAWRSELARTGEFRALGERHYGEALRAERLAALRRLGPALRDALPELDWPRAALAGYETGAQTALDARADAGWQAVIAISPPVMTAPADGAPVLIVTSDLDHDPLGLMRRPADRRATFDSLAPGSAWWYEATGLSHAALAGTLPPADWQRQDLHRPPGLAVNPGPRQPGIDPGPDRPAGGGARGPRSGSATEAAQADLGEALALTCDFLAAPRSAPRAALAGRLQRR